MGIMRVGLVIACAGLVGAACSEQNNVAAPASGPTPTAVSSVISKATWAGGVWPFTVPDGVLKCYSEDSMVTFTAAGIEYGLNATARRFGNFRDIDEIVPAGPEGYVEINGTSQPVKTHAVSLEAINARAQELCT
jgi:hypothetical protein